MHISIALCTYNGEQYLQDQLDSIAGQTRLPDELVVFDDVSSDRTLAILQAFAATAPFRTHIEQNPANVGSTRNFEKAIRKCSGDVIALCDQDDFWYPHKLARIEEALDNHPDKGLVFSDADLVDDQLQPLHLTMWKSIGLAPALYPSIQSPEAFAMLLKRRYITGATLAFRAAFRDVVLPISPNWVHDGWISVNMAAHSTFVLVPESLIQYRQHAKNQIGAKRLTYKNVFQWAWTLARTQPHTYTRMYQAHQDLLEHLTQHLDSEQAADLLNQVQDKIDHWEIRASLDMPYWQRIQKIVGELGNGRYQKYSVRGTWSALRDILHATVSAIDKQP